MDAKKYDRQVELVDISEAQELVVNMLMQEGAWRFQDAVVAALKERGMMDAITVVEEVDLDIRKR
jgi:hypothetical protein